MRSSNKNKTTLLCLLFDYVSMTLQCAQAFTTKIFLFVT